MKAPSDVDNVLFRAMWAACNLQMELVRCIGWQQDHQCLKAEHVDGVEDRINELGSEIDQLRRLPTWPEDDSRDEPDP